MYDDSVHQKNGCRRVSLTATPLGYMLWEWVHNLHGVSAVVVAILCAVVSFTGLFYLFGWSTWIVSIRKDEKERQARLREETE